MPSVDFARKVLSLSELNIVHIKYLSFCQHFTVKITGMVFVSKGYYQKLIRTKKICTNKMEKGFVQHLTGKFVSFDGLKC